MFGMYGLRAKVLIGFGGLLLILVAVSVLANTVLTRYRQASERMLREDLDSLAADQEMRDAIAGIDDVLQQMTFGPDAVSTGGAAGAPRAAVGTVGEAPAAALPPASARTPEQAVERIRRLAATFEKGLAEQQAEMTLAQERAPTNDLDRLWKQYEPAALRLPTLPPGERGKLYAELADESRRMKRDTTQIAWANIENMRSGQGQVHRMAQAAQWAMSLLTLCGCVAGATFAYLLGRTILRPVAALTASVQEVRRGNLDSNVPVRSHDELGALATAFNEMAAQLRVFRRIDHEKLIRTQRTTQMAIDSLPDAVVLLGPDGQIELTNQTAKRLFAVAPQVDLARRTPAWLAELQRRVAANARGDGSGTAATNPGAAVAPRGYESAIRVNDDGREQTFLPKVVPILDDEGRHVVGMTVVLADVTDLKRLDEMKNGLLSLVSHELKTPLTSMRMVLHLLVEEKLGPLGSRQRELLTAAREDSDRLHQIVENLMDMARIESGKVLMETAPVPARELVERSVEPLRAAFRDHGIDLGVECASGVDLPAVLADPTRIGHVFVNLLNNALRYTPSGGRVRVGAEDVGDGVEFTVADTGAGIPEPYVGRVFEKFFRVPGQPGDSGSGLGLALAKDIVEAHGGQIGVESEEGRGTTFRFKLPYANAAPQTRTPGGIAALSHGGDVDETAPSAHRPAVPCDARAPQPVGSRGV